MTRLWNRARRLVGWALLLTAGALGIAGVMALPVEDVEGES